VCRASLSNPSYIARAARKVHVDLTKCESEASSDGPDPHSTRRLKKLERRIVTEALEGHKLTVQRAANLADKVGEFLRTQSPNEVISKDSRVSNCRMMFFLMA
jgi:hypothetical protein